MTDLTFQRHEASRRYSKGAVLAGIAKVHRYLIALALVGVAFAVRQLIDPMFGSSGFIFSIFYLAVVLVAYFAGVGPAIFASVLSGTLAYWAFAAPVFALKFNVEALTSMAFFGLTSSVDIYFITGMKRALEKFRVEHRRAELLAEGNANLFREFSERTTNHLQLVSALLQHRANEGVDVAYSSALTEVSQSTLAISRAHRGLRDQMASFVDLPRFADQLLRATAEAAGSGSISPTITGSGISLPVEQATSVATILSECFRATLPRMHVNPILSVDVSDDWVSCRLIVDGASITVGLGERLLDDFSQRIVDASVGQLSGRFACIRDSEKLSFELSFPIVAPPAMPTVVARSRPQSILLH